MWRYIPRGGHPLHVGFLLQAAGRWNRFGEYGCLYTALTERGARAEYEKYLRFAGLTPERDAERDLVTIAVEAARVLDLTDARVLRRMGIAQAQLTSDDEPGLELCRSVADSARAEGHCAILSPSAALDGERNLSIYFDVRPAMLHLDVGGDRKPLNY